MYLKKEESIHEKAHRGHRDHCRLCAGVWPLCDAGEKVPSETVAGAIAADVREKLMPVPEDTFDVPELASAIIAEKENQLEVNVPAITSETAPAHKSTKKRQTAIPTAAATADNADPYRTDIYSQNVYSEECLYDADGNLIGKTTTLPTAFGSDTIWIDGHAYYNVPGFGLVEWSGPGQRTEDYTMYESGVKIGSMGSEDEPGTPSPALPKPSGEVIDRPSTHVHRKTAHRRITSRKQRLPPTKSHPHGHIRRGGEFVLCSIFSQRHLPKFCAAAPCR